MPLKLPVAQGLSATTHISRDDPSIVGYDQRSRCYVSSSWTDYHSAMADDPVGEQRVEFLKGITSRPGWSVARLAREAGRNASTIWDWMNPNISTEKITVESINKIAAATGDHPLTVFRAFTGLIEEEPEDEAIGLVLQSDLDDAEKTRMIRNIMARREQDSARRVQDTIEMIRLAQRATG